MADHPPPDNSRSYHNPVLLTETLELLNARPGSIVLDATLGGGGHAKAIAERITPGGVLYGLDRDPEALAQAGKTLRQIAGVHLNLLHSTFGEMESALRSSGGPEEIMFDGVLFDFGVSSHQLDTERGFSFRHDVRLDMRMDASDASQLTAADILATKSEHEIARILWEYGEEKWSRRIARRIIERRSAGDPIRTTGQFASLIEQSIPRAAWPNNIHVATRSFQALRIEVNSELEELRAGLRAAVDRLRPGGRLIAISYHSLEDRIVKQMFATWAGRGLSVSGSSPAALMPVLNIEALGTLLTRKPLAPTDTEMARNPRARSAKLRAFQRNTQTNS